jgi:hypothetical protein
VLEVLGDEVTNEACEVTTSITAIKDVFELFSSFLIDQFKIVVRLIDKLPF